MVVREVALSPHQTSSPRENASFCPWTGLVRIAASRRPAVRRSVVAGTGRGRDEVGHSKDPLADPPPKVRDGTPDELADIFEVFDVSATYDKLHLAASVTAELVAENENPERPGTRRGIRT